MRRLQTGHSALRRVLRPHEVQRVQKCRENCLRDCRHRTSGASREIPRFLHRGFTPTESRTVDLRQRGRDGRGWAIDSAVETDEDGVTFEWLVAHIVKNEMSGISSFGVRIADLEVGGDYDVLARLEDVIVFIECKTGTIGQISRADIDRFISRDGEISPNLSLFILDRNGLTDDFCNMWGQAWGARGMGPLGPRKRSKRRRGVFYEAMPSKHVVTSEGNLVNNIRLSVNHYVTWVKPYGMVAPDETAHRDHYDEYEE